MQIPAICLFQTERHCYAFDSGTGQYVRVPEGVFCFLKECQQDTGQDLSIPPSLMVKYRSEVEWIKGVKEEHGVFKETDHGSPSYPYNGKQLRYLQDHRANTMILELTRQCNLRCRYCVLSDDYPGKPSYSAEHRMSRETIASSVEYLVTHSTDSRHLLLSFYGGEPLLELDSIRYAVSELRRRAGRRQLQFSMTTNGTLLNADAAQFLVENDFNLAISLDGPKRLHDTNRIRVTGEGTFTDIMRNIHHLMETAPTYVDERVRFLSVVPDHRLVGYVYSFFSDLGLPFTANWLNSHSIASPMKYWPTGLLESAAEVAGSMNKLREEYITRLSSQGNLNGLPLLAELFNDSFSRILIVPKARSDESYTFWPAGPCNLGVDKLFVDTKGNLYPCEKVNYSLEMFKLGDVQHGIDECRCWALIDRLAKKADKCRACWAVSMCPKCWLDLEYSDDSCNTFLKHTISLMRNAMHLLELNPNVMRYFDGMLPSFSD